MMENRESKPTTVPEARHVGEIHAQWEWVEPSIWTDRMLTALENGVKGGKWHNKWPNAYFTGLGLFSLSEAWESARQSVKR